jgi:hypothetical protein
MEPSKNYQNVEGSIRGVPGMQTIVAGLMALTAMGASILADVDPLTVVTRGGIAFFAGIVVASVWTSVVNPSQPKPKAEKKPKEAKPKKAEVESDEKAKPEEDMEEAA